MDVDVIGDHALFDDVSDKAKVGVAGGGERDLDLLETDLDELLEEPEFLLSAHRVDEGLVSIAKVDRGPNGRLGVDLAWPSSVGEVDGLVWRVLVARIHGRHLGAIRSSMVGYKKGMRIVLLSCCVMCDGVTTGKRERRRMLRRKTQQSWVVCFQRESAAVHCSPAVRDHVDSKKWEGAAHQTG